MAVTYGFFNSVNGDRKYNADQMSEYFRGIVSQGVFQHLDSGMAVSAGTGLSVSVAAGRAIIQNRWVQNSAALNLTISDASETYGRKDAVVIRLDKSSRAISITVKTGTPAASPVAPEMTRNATTYEMALAYVNVAAGASSVTVTDKRSDSSVCGWAAVAQATSGEVDQMLNDMKTGFDGVVYQSPAAMVQGEDQKLSDAITTAINRRGTAYYQGNNLTVPKYLTGTQGNCESISGDECNILHFVNSGSAVNWYFALSTGGLSSGTTFYVSFKAKASASNIGIKLESINGSTITTLKTTTLSLDWKTYTYSVTLASDIVSLKFNLSVVGEVWLTNLIVSTSEINYDYSVKSKVADMAPKVDLLDSGLTIEQFASDLKSNFYYHFSKLTLTLASGYMKTNGEVDTSTGKYATISVLAGEQYKITTNHGASLRAYVLKDSNGNVVQYWPLNSVSTTTDTVEVVMPVDGTLYVNTFASSEIVVRKAVGTGVNSYGGIAGKRWCAIGDSITEYASGYHSIIEALTGVSVINRGTSGCGYMKPVNDRTFVDRSQLTSVYDIVTIFGSVNDMQYVADHLGTATDTGTSTLGGCFNSVISNFYASGNYHIGVISPIPNDSTAGNPSNTSGSFAQYVNLMKEVCQLRGVPFLDLWHCSNMQPWDASFAAAYMQDNTHPNADGHAIFAPRIMAFIESL